MEMGMKLRCIDCGATYPLSEVRYTCDCGGLFDVARDLEELRENISRETFDRRLGGRKVADASGVWRFREMILTVPEDQIVSRPEGNTPQYRSSRLARWVGLDDLALKH